MNYKFAIELLPDSQNKWDHYHWAKRQKIMDWWKILTKSKVNHCAVYFHGEKVKVTIKLWFKRNARRDGQNYISGLKGMFDGLEKAGIVKDDCDLVVSCPTFGVDKKYPRTEIELESIL